jgi:UDP-N-acetyl-2-amino-2-deoxyglucuronate dehydrogenase
LSTKAYRIAIIGTGGIAHTHALAIAELDNATLVAGCGRRQEVARKFADRHGCRHYIDQAQMLDEQKPDVVAVCTPSGAHLEPTLACIERGIDVLCEKPLEITTGRVDQMIAAAAEAGVTLGGIFPSRFNPALLLMRDAVAARRFGQIAIACAAVPWWRQDDYYAPQRWQGTLALDGGGALMNQSIHVIDSLQWIMSAAMPQLDAAANPVAEVVAYTGKLGHDADLIEVEDTCVALLKFRNGALGQILAATSMYPGSERRILIAGRNGTAEVLEEQLTVFNFRDEQPGDAKLLEQFAAKTSATGASDPLAIGHEGHSRNIAAFLEALDRGQIPSVDGVQARKAVAIIEAIYQSAAQRVPVQVS